MKKKNRKKKKKRKKKRKMENKKKTVTEIFAKAKSHFETQLPIIGNKFLVACTRLYRSPCRSVGPSVGPSVRP